MNDFALNENLDVIVGDTDITTVTGNDELDQRVATTLRTRLDEFEPADGLGLDDGNLFGKQIRVDYLETDILDALATQVPEIQVTKVEVGEPDELRRLPIELAYIRPDGSSTSQDINLSQGGE